MLRNVCSSFLFDIETIESGGAKAARFSINLSWATKSRTNNVHNHGWDEPRPKEDHDFAVWGPAQPPTECQNTVAIIDTQFEMEAASPSPWVPQCYQGRKNLFEGWEDYVYSVTDRNITSLERNLIWQNVVLELTRSPIVPDVDCDNRYEDGEQTDGQHYPRSDKATFGRQSSFLRCVWDFLPRWFA